MIAKRDMRWLKTKAENEMRNYNGRIQNAKHAIIERFAKCTDGTLQ